MVFSDNGLLNLLGRAVARGPWPWPRTGCGCQPTGRSPSLQDLTLQVLREGGNTPPAQGPWGPRPSLPASCCAQKSPVPSLGLSGCTFPSLGRPLWPLGPRPSPAGGTLWKAPRSRSADTGRGEGRPQPRGRVPAEVPAAASQPQSLPFPRPSPRWVLLPSCPYKERARGASPWGQSWLAWAQQGLRVSSQHTASGLAPGPPGQSIHRSRKHSAVAQARTPGCSKPRP